MPAVLFVAPGCSGADTPINNFFLINAAQNSLEGEAIGLCEVEEWVFQNLMLANICTINAAIPRWEVKQRNFGDLLCGETICRPYALPVFCSN